MPKCLTIFAAALFAFGCADSDPSPPAADPNPPARRTFTRAEFKADVLATHHSPDALHELLGMPDETLEYGRRARWTYHGITIDPATGAVDSHVDLLFTDNCTMGARYPDGREDW